MSVPGPKPRATAVGRGPEGGSPHAVMGSRGEAPVELRPFFVNWYLNFDVMESESVCSVLHIASGVVHGLKK